MIKVFDHNFDAAVFDRAAKHPLQSWAWGRAREKTGVTVVRLGEYTKNQLKNVFQMTLHPIPKTPYLVGYLPRSVFPSKEVSDFLYEWAKKNKIIFIKIEPYVEKSEVKHPSHKLKISKHPLFPNWTQVLDLTKSEEQLLAQMHHKTRYNIRLATRRGVTAREESNDRGFETFIKLYFETTKRQKYFGHDLRYHQIIWDNLKNDVSHIMIAYFGKEPLAAYQLFLFKDRFYYVYGGTAEIYRNFMASNLLMWEAIRLGKKLGARALDMWGSLPPNYKQTHSWAGFTRFKEGYGTEFKEFAGSFDLVISPWQYSAYNLIHALREFYLRLKRFLF